MPIALLTTPPEKDGNFALLTNRWWSVVEDHLVFCYYTSPQCNGNKEIAAMMKGEVRFIPKTYIPIDYFGAYKIIHLLDQSSEGST